jgi:hypothetical protein
MNLAILDKNLKKLHAKKVLGLCKYMTITLPRVTNGGAK